MGLRSSANVVFTCRAGDSGSESILVGSVTIGIGDDVTFVGIGAVG